MKGVNWIAVVVAVVVLQAIGFAWYSFLFADPWMAAVNEAGLTLDMSTANTAMALGAVNTVIIVLGLSWLLRRAGMAGLQASVVGAGLAWFFFNFTTMAVDYLYLQLPSALVGINMGYQLVAYLAAGAVLGLMPAKAAASAA